MKYRFREADVENANSDDREMLYKSRQYVLIGSDGWVDVRGLSVNIIKTDDGVRLEVWPVETDGLSATRPLGTMEVTEPEKERGPSPRKRFNCVKGKRK